MVDVEDVYFPYPQVRSGQEKFISNVYEIIENNKTLLVSAPTGLGKTICSLAPTLTQAIRYNKKVIYLTSRQTQVNQVLETLNHINQKREQAGKSKMRATAFIGKKNMCYVPVSAEHPKHPENALNAETQKIKLNMRISHHVLKMLHQLKNLLKYVEMRGFVHTLLLI
jgi:Rad3-related DNA helicase